MRSLLLAILFSSLLPIGTIAQSPATLIVDTATP